jgi:hypothetical protein
MFECGRSRQSSLKEMGRLNNTVLSTVVTIPEESQKGEKKERDRSESEGNRLSKKQRLLLSILESTQYSY